MGGHGRAAPRTSRRAVRVFANERTGPRPGEWRQELAGRRIEHGAPVNADIRRGRAAEREAQRRRYRFARVHRAAVGRRTHSQASSSSVVPFAEPERPTS